MTKALTAPPLIVLDTNVVLDWLVFHDPSCAALIDAIERTAVRWVATVQMRRELGHVLARGTLDAWQPDLPALWAAWDRHCTVLPEPPPRLAPRMRCTDPDDQKFIELALATRARWLLSHDRAVRKLGPALRARGTLVLTPAAWTKAVQAG